MNSKKLFFLCMILAVSGFVSPPLALLSGIVFGFTVAHPYRTQSHSLAKFLLQASVIGLGFGMNLHEVIHAGKSGFLYTAMSITAAMALGLLLGKVLKVKSRASFLITSHVERPSAAAAPSQRSLPSRMLMKRISAYSALIPDTSEEEFALSYSKKNSLTRWSIFSSVLRASISKIPRTINLC